MKNSQFKINFYEFYECIITNDDYPAYHKTPEMIRGSVEGYMSSKNAIILSVMPSNVHMNARLLTGLIKEHVPKGIRTIGVLTKIDAFKFFINNINLRNV